jgi:hypothetical protein
MNLKKTKVSLLLALCLFGFVLVDKAGAQVKTRILGGSFQSTANFPVAYLANSSVACSGSAIGKKTILTAAHCVKGFGKEFPDVYLRGRRYKTKKMFRGPNDLGIIQTTSKMSAGKVFGIVRNVLPNFRGNVGVFGYGQPDSGHLKYTEMAALAFNGTGFIILASIDGSTTCVGDSGGPAVMISRNKPVVIAVVSSGQSACGFGSSTSFGLVSTGAGYSWVTGTRSKTEK